MLRDRRVGFKINRCHFWTWDMFGVVLRNSLTNIRWLKCWTMLHALACNVVSHTTEIIDHHKIFIYYRCNNWSNWFIRHPNIMKRQCQIIIWVLSNERLIYMILRWYWSLMDAWNNGTLGMIWIWRIWVQDVWGIVVFKKLSYVFNSIWLVDINFPLFERNLTKEDCLTVRKTLIVGQEMRISR